MSQYSISVNAIVQLLSGEHTHIMQDKIKLAKKVLFNFNYEGDTTFKELLENNFILKHIDDNINVNTYDRWLLMLETEVKTLSPLYYKKYKFIKEVEYSELSQGGKETITREYESNNNSHQNSNSKQLSSEYPYQVAHSSFNSINYMNNGGQSEDSATQSGDTKGIEKVTSQKEINVLDKIETFNNLIVNVLDDFQNELTKKLFIGIM